MRDMHRRQWGQHTCAGELAGAGRAACVLDGQHDVAAGGELGAEQAVRGARAGQPVREQYDGEGAVGFRERSALRAPLHING